MLRIACFSFAVTLGSSSTCDYCGSSSTYSEAISTDSNSGKMKRTITATGCPNHYNLCTGKASISVCGDTGEEGTASEATEQTWSKMIPAEPVLATRNSSVECTVGTIALALNGVAIFSGAVDSSCTLLDVDNAMSKCCVQWVQPSRGSRVAQRTNFTHALPPPHR